MAADISVKIALDGERDYRQALKNCNDALKNADSALKAFDESAKGNEKSIENLKERQKLLGDALKAAKEKQEQMTTAVNNAKAARDKAAEAVQKARKEEGENSEAVKKAEKQYIAANNAVDRWETQLNKANEQVAKYTNEMNGATEETSDFQKVVSNTAAMEALTKIADKVSGAMSKVNKAMKDASKEVETGLKQINKRTGASGAELEKYQRIARDVFTSIPTSIDTASDAVGELATRFKDLTDDQLANLTTAFVKFADLNETDVATAVDSTQKAMAAFGVEIDDAGQLLDVFNRTGQNTGTNAADLASKLTQNAEAFQQMGMDIYQATEFLGDLETSGADSSAVLMGLKQALKKATDEGKPFNEALAEMQDAIVNGTEDMDGLSYAYEIFGTRSGAQVYNAVKNGTIDFKNLAQTTDILTDAQDNLNDTYDNSLTVYDKYQIAQNNLKDAAEDLQGEMNEALAPAIDAVSGVIKDLTDKFKDLPPEIQTAIGLIAKIGTTAVEAVPQVLALITQIKALKVAKAQAAGLNGLNSAVSGVGKSSKSTAGIILSGIGILGAFGAAVTAAGEAVRKNNEATVAAGAAYETSLKTGVDDARVAFEEVVVTLGDVDEAQQAVSEATEIQQTALQALNKANSDYTDFLVKYPAFAQGYAKAGDTIQDNTGKTVTVTKDLWQQYQSLQLRTSEAASALNSANGLVKDTTSFLSGLEGQARQAANSVDALGAETKSAVNEMTSSVNQAANNTSTYNNGYNIGANLALGIVKGIRYNADAAVNAAAAMANRTISKVRNIMAIQSPSKVFEQIGMYMDQGLAQGIEKYAYQPDRAITDMTKSLIQAPDLSRYDSASAINNQVAVYIGDKELTAIMAAGVVKNISSNQRAQYVASGGR